MTYHTYVVTHRLTGHGVVCCARSEEAAILMAHRWWRKRMGLGDDWKHPEMFSALRVEPGKFVEI